MCRTFAFRRFLFLGMVLWVAGPVQAQTYDPQPVKRPPRQAIVVSTGVTFPVGREVLREFWLRGLGASVTYLIYPSSTLALGVGIDISWLYFDLEGFTRRWAGVSLAEKQNLTLGHVHFDAAYYFLKGNQTRPFVSVQLGAETISQATLRRVINGVSQTYYDVGGKGRLAFGIAGGADIQIEPFLAIHTELKGTIILNDPNVSFLLHLRAGVQYKF